MNRRDFLRAAGVTLALPSFALRASEGGPSVARSTGAKEGKRRLICLCAPLGLHPEFFFPDATGSSPYLDVLKDFRSEYTVVSGLAHAGMSPGFAHQASASFLTGAEGAGRPGFHNTVSVDQVAAEHLEGQTRIPSLVLSGEGGGLSWTRTGAPVPADTSPSRVFARLFLADTPEAVRAHERRLSDGRSVLDDVGGQAKKLKSGLGADDRDKLDEYITSVRDLEKRLERDEAWFRKPKPKVDAKPPADIPSSADLIGRMKLLFELTHLAIQTDSTRIVTIMLGGATSAPPIAGVTLGHHDLSHHGKDPGKLDQLKIVELETMKTLRDLLAKLKGSKEEGATLLDRTSVFLGSNLGDGSSHSVRNLPVLVAGGGFKHGRHLAFNPQTPPPLCNLYVTLLQGLGLPVDRFSNATGTLTGL